MFHTQPRTLNALKTRVDAQNIFKKLIKNYFQYEKYEKLKHFEIFNTR